MSDFNQYVATGLKHTHTHTYLATILRVSSFNIWEVMSCIYMQAGVLWFPLLLGCSSATASLTLKQWIMHCVESEGIFYMTYAWL